MIEFSAQQIASLLGGKVIGDPNRKVSDVGPLESAHEGQLSFLCEEKYLPQLETTNASVVLLTSGLRDDNETITGRCTIILVENARAAMGQLLQLVAKALNPTKQGIEQPCFIAEAYKFRKMLILVLSLISAKMFNSVKVCRSILTATSAITSR